MNKEYEIRHYPTDNPAWRVEAFWINREGYEDSRVEGEFYNRKNARLFLKALKGKFGKPPKRKSTLSWPPE
jgi:hypothetical protein